MCIPGRQKIRLVDVVVTKLREIDKSQILIMDFASKLLIVSCRTYVLEVQNQEQ